MKIISRLPTINIGRLCMISVLIAFCTALVASCSIPAKTGKPSAESSGKIKGSNQNIQQKVDELSIRLKQIEQRIGLDETQNTPESLLSDDGEPSTESSQSSANSSGGITEEGLPPNDSHDELFESDTSASPYSSKSKVPLSSKWRASSADGSSSPQVQYNKARQLLLANKFNAAEKEFKAVAEEYSNNPLAVNSLYWIGECRYSMKDYKGAITIFKQLVEKYPNGSKVPDALLKTAYAYISIGDDDNAREYLKRVVKTFPFSPSGEKAEKKLQSLK